MWLKRTVSIKWVRNVFLKATLLQMGVALRSQLSTFNTRLDLDKSLFFLKHETAPFQLEATVFQADIHPS